MSPIGLTVTLCAVTFFAQVSAGQEMVLGEARVATCDLSDVGSSFEQLITQAVYTLADVVITLEGSLYQTVSCASSGFSGFWSCTASVWAEEASSIQDSVQTYFSTAQDLISEIVQDLVSCVNL